MLGLNLKIIVDVVPAMILPKNSLLTAMFREDILWLHERGIMQDLMLKWKGGVISAQDGSGLFYLKVHEQWHIWYFWKADDQTIPLVCCI